MFLETDDKIEHVLTLVDEEVSDKICILYVCKGFCFSCLSNSIKLAAKYSREFRCSPEEEDFVEYVFCDIKHFFDNVCIGNRHNTHSKSVLIFPPVNSYRRFLIHSTCQNVSADLVHFSIGFDEDRRTVICLKDLIERKSSMGIEQNVTPSSSHLIVEKKGKTMPSVGIYRPPAARRLCPPETSTSADPSVEKPKTKQKQRRPDIQVYVPRAKRSSTGPCPDINLSIAAVPATVTANCRPSEITKPASPMSFSVLQPSDQAHLFSQPDTTTLATASTKNIKEDSNTAVYLGQVEADSISCVTPNECSSVKEIHKLCLNDVQKLGIFSDVTSKSDLQVYDNLSTNSDSVSPLPTEIYCRDESCSDTDTISDTVINSLQADGEKYVKCTNDFINVSIRTDVPCAKRPVFTRQRIEATDEDIGLRPITSEIESFLLEYPLPLNPSCLVEILPTNEREQKCEDELTDIGRNRDEQNRKNRSIQRGNIKYLSDVLVISDVGLEPNTLNCRADDCLNVPTETSRLASQSCDSEEVTCKSDDKGMINSNSKSRLNPDECTWDMMFDDSGDCLDPFLLEELTSKVGSVSIKTPRSDYKNYTTTREIQPTDSLAHIIEIYNFPPEFKTQDLMSIFSGYQSRGFEIKWVDDTHALGVFGSSVIADEVLETSLPFVKTRRLSEGTAESKAKARRSSEFVQPYRARPETCPALARRLVTSALGVRLSTARQEREAEKALLKVARDKKKLVARLKDAAWEGTLEGTMSNAE